MKLRPAKSLFWITSIGLLLPLFALLFSWFVPAPDIWRHLWSTVLTDYFLNSLLLCALVGSGTLLFGASAGFLVARHAFFGKKILQWFVLLPFAFPPYLLAYVYGQIFQVGGPLHVWFGEQPQFQIVFENWPSIRNIWGCAAVFVLALTPYVYLLARAHFLRASRAPEEAARMLGASRFQVHSKVLWPMAWPVLASGVFLVLMEVLADFGTVEHMAVETLTSGVFKIWFGLGNSAAAAQLSSCVAMGLFCMLLFENKLRRSQSHTVQRPSPMIRGPKVSVIMQFLIWVFLSVPLLFGFLLPAGFLIQQSLTLEAFPHDFLPTMGRSFGLAGVSATACLVIGLFLAGYVRRHKKFLSIAQSAASGYALPGAMVAMGVLILGVASEKGSQWLSSWGISGAWLPLLSGSVVALIFVYVVRFVALPFQSLLGAYSSLSLNYDDAAHSLGCSSRQVVYKIHWPHVRPFLASAWFLVFVDVLKELPATLILRPFGFETLPIRVYTLASDERIAAAGPYALVLVALGCLVVMILALHHAQESI